MDKVRVNVVGPKLSIYKTLLFGVLWFDFACVPDKRPELLCNTRDIQTGQVWFPF